MLGIPGFQREKNLLQRLGKKNIRKLIWMKQRVCVLFKTSTFFNKCTTGFHSALSTADSCDPCHPEALV